MFSAEPKMAKYFLRTRFPGLGTFSTSGVYQHNTLTMVQAREKVEVVLVASKVVVAIVGQTLTKGLFKYKATCIAISQCFCA